MTEPTKSFEPFDLTCLDHTAGPVFMNIFLTFKPANIGESLTTIEDGSTLLIDRLPFLAGDVVNSQKVDGSVNVMRIQPSSTLIREIPMLLTRRHPHHTVPSTPRVFDATGVGLLIEMLAACCRGDCLALDSQTELEEEIRLRRSVDDIGIGATDQTSRRRETQDLASSTMCSPAHASMGNASSAPPKLSVYAFNLSAANLAQLKTACNKLLPVIRASQKGSLEPAESEVEILEQEFVSTNDILTALLGTSIRQARNRVTEPELVPIKSKLAMAVNLRERTPSLPRTNLGNSLTISEAFVHSLGATDGLGDVPEKQHHPDIGNPFLMEITRVALALRKELAAIDDAYFRQFVSRLWASSDWSQMGATLPDTMVSSWRHLTVYHLDFGPTLSRVVEFHPQTALVDGICIIHPERVVNHHDSGEVALQPWWEVSVTLQCSAMKSLLSNGVLNFFSQGVIRRI